MSTTPVFTAAEIQIAQDALIERYRRDVPVEQADVEVRLRPGDRELVERPAFTASAITASTSNTAPAGRNTTTSSNAS